MTHEEKVQKLYQVYKTISDDYEKKNPRSIINPFVPFNSGEKIVRIVIHIFPSIYEKTNVFGDSYPLFYTDINDCISDCTKKRMIFNESENVSNKAFTDIDPSFLPLLYFYSLGAYLFTHPEKKSDFKENIAAAISICENDDMVTFIQKSFELNADIKINADIKNSFSAEKLKDIIKKDYPDFTLPPNFIDETKQNPLYYFALLYHINFFEYLKKGGNNKEEINSTLSKLFNISIEDAKKFRNYCEKGTVDEVRKGRIKQIKQYLNDIIDMETKTSEITSKKII